MMGVAEMLAMSGGVMLISVGWVLLIPFLVIYILGDVHGRRAGNRDPQHGTKVLLTLLISIAWQAVLAGAAMYAAYMVDDVLPEAAWKTGMGLAVGGALAGALPFIGYRAVRQQGRFAVERQAYGINGVVTGLTFMALVVTSTVLWFNDQDIAIPLSIAFVYLLGSVVSLRALSSLNA